MQYWLGFVVVVGLVAAPVVAQGQGATSASGTDAWLQLELNEPEGLRVPSVSRPSLAYVPEHFKDPARASPDNRAATVEGATPQPAPGTDTADERKPEAEPYVVDPNLSPIDIRRWHPEAFDPSVTSDREIELEYATPGTTEESKSRVSRGGRIAIGVLIPVLFLTAIAAAATASAFNNMEIL